MLNITTLNNGLRIVNEYMPDIESVSVNVWIHTGSRNETKQNNGISHFLEHMAFKGTTSRNTQQIAEDFDDIGGIVNAFTSISNTAYYTKVLKEHTERAVELLADIIQNSIFTQEEIEKERQVILQELAMTKDDPSDIINDYFSETAFANQPYGRSILGPAKNIKKFTKYDIISYIENQYKTEDIVISFAGKLENEDAVKLAKKYFTKLNVGKNKLPQKAVYTGGYFLKSKKLEQTQLIMGLESCSIFDKDYYTAGVLGMILGGGMSSRLFQEIREKKGLCYRIGASNGSNNDTGILEIYSAVSPEKTNETIKSIITELKKITDKISKEEFNRAIVKFKSSILMGKESNTNRSQKNASQILTRNKIISTEEIIEELEKININMVKDFMGKILSKSQPTIAILGKVNKNEILNLNQIKELIKQ